MEAKFTPGNWNQSHRKTRNGMYSTEVYSETGEAIAVVSWYKKPPRYEIICGKQVVITETYREANAKLIAAAPEMFEALKSIVEYWETPKTGSLHDHILHSLEIAESAIKKATSCE